MAPPDPIPNSKHHYAFAHYILRQIAFANPVAIFGVLASEARTRFLDDVLRDVDTRIKDEHHRNFSGADIGFKACSIDNRPCAILEMPPTTNPTEAFFIAILSQLPKEAFVELVNQKDPPPDLIEYFTLERPALISPERPSVFCSWNKDGSHLNYGAGPAPKMEEFIAFLTQRVQSRSAK